MSKTWFITGASRGLGADIAAAALKAGDRVVATGRQRSPPSADSLGPDTRPAAVAGARRQRRRARRTTAVAEAVERFGAHRRARQQRGLRPPRIFRGNHARRHRGAVRDQRVRTVQRHARRAARDARRARRPRLQPVVDGRHARHRRCGSLYCSSKFAVEGFSEALALELAPFGVHVTIIEPGPFRTDFLTPESLQLRRHERSPTTRSAAPPMRASFEQRNGKQPGDPVQARRGDGAARRTTPRRRCASPPARWPSRCGTPSSETMHAELDKWRALGVATDF